MKNLLLVFLSLIFIASTCVMDKDTDMDPDSTLTIINNSNTDLIVVTSVTSFDTLIDKMSFIKVKYQQDKLTLLADSIVNYRSNWIYSLTNIGSPGLLRIFFFDKDTVNNNSWENIVANYMIIKRYEYTLNDLDRLNWKITFP
jgi:hypothetical protein